MGLVYTWGQAYAMESDWVWVYRQAESLDLPAMEGILQIV